MNNIVDLNQALFKRIEALENDDLSDDELDREIKKSDAVVKISACILNQAKIALDAQKQFDEYATGRTVEIPLLGISNANLMAENKRLRQRLLAKEDRYE